MYPYEAQKWQINWILNKTGDNIDNNLSPVEPSFTKCACRTLKIRRAAIIVNSKTRQGGLNGISSVKIAEKVRLLSKRCRNCVSSPHVPLISHYCVFRQNIRLFSLSLEHIYLYYMSSE